MSGVTPIQALFSLERGFHSYQLNTRFKLRLKWHRTWYPGKSIATQGWAMRPIARSLPMGTRAPAVIVHTRRGGARSALHRQFARIVDGIDNPVIANPDSPAVFIAVQLLASRRSQVIGEFTHSWPDALDDVRCQVTKFPFRGHGKGDFVQRHLILPSERSSASTSSKLKRGSPARPSEMMPSSISS